MLGNYTTVFPRCKGKNAVFSGIFTLFFLQYNILGQAAALTHEIHAAPYSFSQGPASPTALNGTFHLYF